MIQFKQPGMAHSSGSSISVSQDRIDELFWQENNVEENIRHILSEFAGELQKMKRQREA